MYKKEGGLGIKRVEYIMIYVCARAWSLFAKAGSLGGVLGKGEFIEGKKFLGDELHMEMEKDLRVERYC